MQQKLELSKDLGFLRIGTAVPDIRVADVAYNVKSIINLIEKANSENVQVLCFPEMCITGYTIGDLIQQQALLTRAERGLRDILEFSVRYNIIIVVGLPLSIHQKIFNCAVVLCSGNILGVVPKTYLPSYKEFYENRWFVSGDETCSDTIELLGKTVYFGTDILFALKGIPSAIIGIEMCEDLWIPLSPHEYQSLAGATVLLNLSASNDILAKADWRKLIVASESGRCIAAYCYVSAGTGESSNDVVFGGHIIIAENGNILQESRNIPYSSQLIVSDIDLDILVHDRQMITSFRQSARHLKAFKVIEAAADDIPADRLIRNIDPHPFVPNDVIRRAERCRNIFAMQIASLTQKLTGSNINRIVLGVSGGLDSTLALLAAVKTMDSLGLPRKNVYAYTLPGFGTTKRTKNNATNLCHALGVNFESINIIRTCKAHMVDLGHNGKEDIVFENLQARYRTELLLNKANELNAILLGTGDLTEVALGWCTFSGDHISHYHINISVPKTLVRYLIRWVADEELADVETRKILYDVLETPISPELKRPTNGKIGQMSEDIIGPVELADFFLYPFIRFGTRPGKILFIANEVRKRKLFDSRYTLDDLHSWLRSFTQRFFANQFKRTCMPEGPKIGSVSLSPRGDWRMPSDAQPLLWLEDLEATYRKLKVTKAH